MIPDDEETNPGGAPAADFDSDEPTHASKPPVDHAFDASDAAATGAQTPRIESIVESLIFAADKPLGLKAIGDLLGESELDKVRLAVEAIEANCRDRGIQLHSVAGGWQFRTHPDNAAWVQKLLAQKPVRLTRAQLETLAICAYRQPITRPEIDEIRGVDSGGTLKTLMDRSLVRILGKKEEPGRPILYGTTKDFLEFFNLGDLKDLPTLREFHELSEEHKAQVEALESAAPEGSIETEEEATARPLQRVELKPIADDSKELEEIDQLISTAGGDKPIDLGPGLGDKPPPEKPPEA